MLPYSLGERYYERVYSAPDAATALDFVIRCQQEGRYQFFRGQENSNWHPYPSFVRIPEEARDLAKDRVLRFIGYGREVSCVLGINYSSDDFLAIAQHYGLPTNFLDLTTDPVVAAMFACPPGSAWSNQTAGVLLYDQDTIDLWCKDYPSLELLRIDVSNLWRLQAQRGLFLFNPYENFFDCFNMPDRVIFPHPTDGFVEADYELYPKRKSPLELQLDLFFQLEATENEKEKMRALPMKFIERQHSDKLFINTTPRITAASAHLAEPWLEAETKLHDSLRNNISGISNIQLHTLPDTYFRPMWNFRRGELWPHASWFGKHAMAWLTTPIERFRPEFPEPYDEIAVDLDEFKGALPCGPTAALGTHLELCPRDRDLRFLLQFTSLLATADEEAKGVQTEFLQTVGNVAECLWAGLRRTPADTDLIARSIYNFWTCATLFLRDDWKWDECFGRQDKEHLKLEYVPLGSSSRTAKVLCNDLAPAIRSDFADAVSVILPDYAQNLPAIVVHMRQMIYPQYLFDFERFVDVFIARVLPYEAMIATLTRRTSAGVVLNPRTIKVFGLA